VLPRSFLYHHLPDSVKATRSYFPFNEAWEAHIPLTKTDPVTPVANPCSQGVQSELEVEPALSLTDPAGQSKQDVAASAFPYFPTPQSTHAADDVAPLMLLYRPRLHDVHDAADVEDGVGLYLPEIHAVQLPDERRTLYVPSGHGEHKAAAPVLYSPLGQSMQSLRDCDAVLELNVPAAQLEHGREPM